MYLCIIQLGDDNAGVHAGEKAREGVPPKPEHPGKGAALYLRRVATPLHIGVQLARDGEGGGGLCLMDILHMYLDIVTLFDGKCYMFKRKYYAHFSQSL